jgi:hypothetical protein
MLQKISIYLFILCLQTLLGKVFCISNSNIEFTLKNEIDFLLATIFDEDLH